MEGSFVHWETCPRKLPETTRGSNLAPTVSLLLTLRVTWVFLQESSIPDNLILTFITCFFVKICYFLKFVTWAWSQEDGDSPGLYYIWRTFDNMCWCLWFDDILWRGDSITYFPFLFTFLDCSTKKSISLRFFIIIFKCKKSIKLQIWSCASCTYKEFGEAFTTTSFK